MTEMRLIYYQGGYKYQLAHPYHIQTKIKPPEAIECQFFTLHSSGFLEIQAGYAWDGPSGHKILKELCLEDGMFKIRALWVFRAVRWFSPRYSDPDPKPILVAPKVKK